MGKIIVKAHRRNGKIVKEHTREIKFSGVIRDPNDPRVDRAWRKAQVKYNIKSGDVDPVYVMRMDDKIRYQGLTENQVYQNALSYYKHMEA